MTPELVVRAYAAGVFPMARSQAESRVFWIDPDMRGVLPLDGLRVSRSLRKVLRREVFGVAIDSHFVEVIKQCAASVPGRRETWINPDIESVFTDLHDLGLAHSVECWRGGALVGGLYGLALGGAFFGESMFSREANASKVALCHLVARLKTGGYRLLDTQFTTDHLSSLGAVEIPRADYHQRLAEALQVQARFACPVPDVLEALDTPCGW